MSLLLDALNRASKDKAQASAAAKATAGGEKAAPPVKTSSPSPAAASTPITPAPASTPPAPDWPTIGLELTPANAPAIEPEPVKAVTIEKPTAIEDGLKLVMEPEKVSVPRATETIAPSAALMPTNAPPVAEMPSVKPVQKPDPKPVAKAEPVSAEPRRASPPPDAPRVAQNILRAKAPTAGTGKPTRLIVLGATAALLAMGLGSVMLGWWGDPVNWMQTSSSIQVPSIPPTVAPAETVVEPPMMEPVAAAPDQRAPLIAKPASAIVKVKTPPSGSQVAPRTEEILTECGPGSAGPGCSPPQSKPTTVAPPRKATPTLLQISNAGPSLLETGYAALTKGRLQEASQAYNQALSGNSEERDALLGLAYIAHQQGREDEARAYYRRVLRQDPGNPTARAGLLTLSPSADANELGSRASEVVEQNPDSAAAQSALGHGLVRQGRLADAQLAFQRAQKLEPTVALHAFNLAVALDRMRNYGPALTYYERAMALSAQSGGERTSGVPHAVVESRLEQLRSAIGSRQ